MKFMDQRKVEHRAATNTDALEAVQALEAQLFSIS
jgi:hypothetical protein